MKTHHGGCQEAKNKLKELWKKYQSLLVYNYHLQYSAQVWAVGSGGKTEAVSVLPFLANKNNMLKKKKKKFSLPKSCVEMLWSDETTI